MIPNLIIQNNIQAGRTLALQFSPVSRANQEDLNFNTGFDATRDILINADRNQTPNGGWENRHLDTASADNRVVKNNKDSIQSTTNNLVAQNFSFGGGGSQFQVQQIALTLLRADAKVTLGTQNVFFFFQQNTPANPKILLRMRRATNPAMTGAITLYKDYYQFLRVGSLGQGKDAYLIFTDSMAKPAGIYYYELSFVMNDSNGAFAPFVADAYFNNNTIDYQVEYNTPINAF